MNALVLTYIYVSFTMHNFVPSAGNECFDGMGSIIEPTEASQDTVD